MNTIVTSRSPLSIPNSNDDIGYHQNWYPVALSSEVPSGGVVGKDFLGGRVIVYRGQAGKVTVQSAYCRHLGADLSLGEIVDGCIKCPFHHWEYSSAGPCVKIPAGDKIPPAARLFTFPSAEFLGLIWAFNGEEPLYDAPGFPGVETSKLAYAIEIIDTYPAPIEPWLLITNSCDFQHLVYFT